jgi:Big-like domain-containing protein
MTTFAQALAMINAISGSLGVLSSDVANRVITMNSYLTSLAGMVVDLSTVPTSSVPPAPTGSTPPPTGSNPPTGSTQPSGSISFNYSFNNMAIGEQIIATAMLGTSPVTASVQWSVVPTGVVSLSIDGFNARLGGLAPGKVSLIAKLSDGRAYTATGSVVGNPPPPPPPPTGSVVKVAKVTITPNPASLYVGSTAQFTVKAFDANNVDITSKTSAVNVTSTNSAVAKVVNSTTGTVQGVSAGTVNIEVRADSAGVAWSTLTVSALPAPTGSTPTPPAPTGSTPPAPTGSGTGVQAVRADDVAATMGIGTHFSYNDLLPYASNAAKTIQLIKDSGFRFVRDGLNVNGPPPTVDYRWTTFKSLNSAGIKMVLVTQPQYLGNNKFDTAPYTQQGNIDFAVATLGTSGILAFEGPNEVDNNYTNWGGSTTGFGAVAMQFQTALYNRVKAVAPSIKVLGFTVTSQFGASHSPDLSAVMDGQAIHPYPNAQLPANAIPGEKAFFGQYMNKANKPYWITETGYHTAVNGTVNMYQPGVSEAAQAKYTPRVYLMSVLNNIAYTSIYEFIDEHSDLTNAEMNYGLVRNDGTPKPAYTAMKNMLGILNEKTSAGATFTPTALNVSLSLPANVKSLVMQKSTGHYFVALWQEVSVYNTSAKQDINNPTQNVTLSFGRGFSATNFYTPLTSGAATSLGSRTAGSTMTVAVPDHVVFVELIP